MEQPRAGPSKPAARNKEAEKRARAAERASHCFVFKTLTIGSLG